MSQPRASDTRDRLIEAGLSALAEHGYRGATTREIARRAGVSEITLFRHFSTKANLVEAALETATQPFRGSAVDVTDDLETDLARLAAGYVAFIDRWPELADRVLPELASDPDLGPGAMTVLQGNAAAMSGLLERHRSSLCDAPMEDLVRAFLGPLLARASLRAVLPVGPFDPKAHVQRFLHGYLRN